MLLIFLLYNLKLYYYLSTIEIVGKIFVINIILFVVVRGDKMTKIHKR